MRTGTVLISLGASRRWRGAGTSPGRRSRCFGRGAEYRSVQCIRKARSPRLLREVPRGQPSAPSFLSSPSTPGQRPTHGRCVAHSLTCTVPTGSPSKAYYREVCWAMGLSERTPCAPCKQGKHRECEQPKFLVATVPHREITPNEPTRTSYSCCDGAEAWEVQS